MQSLLRILALCALAPLVPAQLVGGVISPNPAPAGATLSLTAFDATGQGFAYWDQCITMHVAPNGPVVSGFPGPICAPCGTVGPNGSFRATVAVPGNLPPGTYWLRFDVEFGASPCPGTNIWTEWMCFDVQGASFASTLQPVRNSPQAGRSWELQVSNVGAPGAPYVVGASFSTNVGQAVGPATLCLDADLLFQLSYPNALPGLFTNFVGTLDGRGNAANILVNVPQSPVVAWQPLHLQAGVALPGGSISLTNVVNEIIYP